MAKTRLYSFRCGSFDSNCFEVIGFSGNESLSALYRYDIELRVDKEHRSRIDSSAIVHQLCALTFTANADHPGRTVSGTVSSVEELAYFDNYSVLRIQLEPRLCLLKTYRRSKVYLDLDLPGLIDEILKPYSWKKGEHYVVQLQDNYGKVPFVLQYEETDYDFLMRLLEHEGVTFYFTQHHVSQKDSGSEYEQLIITDDATLQPNGPPLSASMHTSQNIKTPEQQNVLLFFRKNVERLPKRVIVTDYNDDTPLLNIQAESLVPEGSFGDVNIRVNFAHDADQADRIARIHAARLYCQGRFYEAKGTAPTVLCGSLLDLHGHVNSQLKARYLVRTVKTTVHNANVPVPHFESAFRQIQGFQTELVCLGTEVVFRPPILTDKPFVRGAIDATVDSSTDGEYADLDDQGRYLVRFPFEYSVANPATMNTHRVRMAQMFAGPKEGAHFPIRKGSHVLVSFLKGDPDRPIITGSVPNAVQSSVVRSQNLTRSVIATHHGNRIEFEDQLGRERISLSTCGAHNRSSIDIGETKLGRPGLEQSVQGIRALRVEGISTMNFRNAETPPADFVFPEISMNPDSFGQPTGNTFSGFDDDDASNDFKELMKYDSLRAETTGFYFLQEQKKRIFFFGPDLWNISYGKASSAAHKEYAGYKFDDGRNMYEYLQNPWPLTSHQNANSSQPYFDFLKNSSTSIEKKDTVSVSQGTSINFNGVCSYSFGPSYSESHTEVDINKFRAKPEPEDRHQGDQIKQLDAYLEGGSQAILSPRKANEYNISKSFGYSYDYSNQVSLSTSLGQSESEDYTESLSIRYDPKTRIRLQQTLDLGSTKHTHKFHPAHGAPASYEVEKDNGFFKASFAYVPTISFDYKMMGSNTVTGHILPSFDLNLYPASKVAVNLTGVDTEVNTVGVKTEVNTVGVKTEMDLIKLKMILGISPGKEIILSNKARLKAKNAPTVETAMAEIKKIQADIKKVQVELEGSNVKVGMNNVKVDSKGVEVNNIKGVELNM